MNREQPYAGLDPDTILAAVESLDLVPDRRLLALNSFENRVWQIGLEGGEPLVAKFYRPGRWSDAAIIEEHDFALELEAAGLPVVAPLAFNGATLHHYGAYRFALFPRRGGHAPELSDPETLRHLGRVLGRWHAIGATRRFQHRPRLTIAAFGREARSELQHCPFLPPHLTALFVELSARLLADVEAAWQRAEPVAEIRLHGDCHPGNILWRDGAHFVDLDDTMSGPAIQDLWMLLAGERDEMTAQLTALLEGYTTFFTFDPRQLHLIEALRSLRLLHYNAWIARRWHDPAFPLAFPWFSEPRHFEQLLNQIREQIAALQEPPLEIIL